MTKRKSERGESMSDAEFRGAVAGILHEMSLNMPGTHPRLTDAIQKLRALFHPPEGGLGDFAAFREENTGRGGN